MFGNYALLIAAVATGYLTPYALLALLSFPLALKTIKHFARNMEKVPDIVPAQAGTIQVHALVGLLMSIGCITGALLKG
jgi:1,4-dihydroxy-2-naphthoate octaprenyltransferase